MKTYTMENFREDFNEAQSIVVQCGLTETNEIEYHLELIPNASFLGQTHKIGYHNYIIRLNQLFAQSEEHSHVLNTVIHEILHSLKNGMCHTGAWKQYASIVYIKTGIKITTKADSSKISNYMECKMQFMLKKNPEKIIYQVICPNCGVIYTYQRKCSVVNKIESGSSTYRCKKCQSKLTIRPIKITDI